jgi:hypothetical protein
MKMRAKSMWMAAAVAIVAMLSLSAVRAQNQNGGAMQPVPPMSSTSPAASGGYGGTPVPAARGVASPYDAQPYDPSQVQPDTNTLSGAENLGVGSLQHARNVFDPSVTVSSWGQTGIAGANGQTGLHATSLVGGGLNFNRSWSRYQFTTSYQGGENLYYGFEQNTPFHNLAVSQDIAWKRWRLHLRDDFAAAPGASFTGGGMGGPGLMGQFTSTLGNSLGSIGQRFQPNETIQTTQAMRYRNTALGEAEFSLSRRSILTFSGSYGLLHFTDAGYINSHMINAQAGYDYLLDAKNSIAVLGSYGKIDYTGTSLSTADYLADLAFGRKITGRLAFQAAGGPEQIRVAGAGSGNFQVWTWSVNSALTYERRRSGVSMGFVRGLSGGSGVLFGAKSNTFSGTVHHQFSRFWSGSANGGYAFNTSLAPVGGTTINFNTSYVGANVSHQMGRHMELGMNYSLVKQSNPPVCPVVGGCGTASLQELFGMTVNWHLRPIE